MKHKKDLPRKYRKYVRWAEVDKQTEKIINGPFWFRETALKFNRRPGRKRYAVRPVLCLPLSMMRPSACSADKTTLFLKNGGHIIDAKAFRKPNRERGDKK